MSDTAISTAQTPIKNTGRTGPSTWYCRYPTLIFVLFVLLETMVLRWNFLWKIQELDLFVFDGSYLQDTFQQTGGATCYLASFLTQFFFYPWLGCLLYAALLVLISWVAVAGFNLKKHLRPFSFIPALAVMLTVTELGYEMVGLHVRGYAFTVPIGVLALMSGFLWYRSIPNNQMRSSFVAIWTLLAYPLVGVYALMGTTLMLLFTLRTWKQSQDKWIWMPLSVGLASLVLLPVLISNTLFSTSASSNPYTVLLPYFPADKMYLWLPYIVLAVSLLVMVLTFPLKTVTASAPFQRLSSLILFGASLLMVHLCGFGDKVFYTELAMEKAFSSDNWQEVLRLSRQTGNRSSELTASYTDLSRHKLGLMGTPAHVSASPFSGDILYYEYGDAEETMRWCLKQAALYGMNVHVLKYLTLAAEETGNNILAYKYVKRLEGTLFYRKWALEQASLIEQSVKSTATP